MSEVDKISLSLGKRCEAALADFVETGAELDSLGGNCPVQAEGEVDGQRFYFRARGGGWQFHVAPTDAEISKADTYYYEEYYGSWPDAGWMHNHEALRFIVQAIGQFRASGIEAAAADAIERGDYRNTPQAPAERVDEVAKLREALRKLETANEALCAKRSQATYDRMIADGCADELAALDEARHEARAALRTHTEGEG